MNTSVSLDASYISTLASFLADTVVISRTPQQLQRILAEEIAINDAIAEFVDIPLPEIELEEEPFLPSN